jgi:hypothetical protein
MDPEQTLVDLLLAIRNNEKADAQYHAEELADWLSKDGFMPNVDHAIAKYQNSASAVLQ